MGVDNPSAGKSQIQVPSANMVTSGGGLSAVSGPGFRDPKSPLEGVGDALIGATKQVGEYLRRQKALAEQNKERDRALTLSKMQADAMVTDTQEFEKFRSTYTGDPLKMQEEYEAKVWTPYLRSQLEAHPDDPKLAEQYNIFATELRAKQLGRGIGVQQDLMAENFKKLMEETQVSIDDSLRANPTKEQLLIAAAQYDNVYKSATNGYRLDEGHQNAISAELRAKKGQLVVSMVRAQAATSTDPEAVRTALNTLADPEVNKFLQDLGDQDTVMGQLQNELERREGAAQKAIRDEFTAWLPGFKAATLLGRAASPDDASKLKRFVANGAIHPDEAMEIAILQQMQPSFNQLMNDSGTMTDAEKANALRILDPRQDKSIPQDELPARIAAYNTFKENFERMDADRKRDPVGAEIVSTGATDIEGVRRTIVAKAKASGQRLDSIRLLQPEEVTTINNQLANLVVSGNVDNFLNFYNDEILGKFGTTGHPERQIAPGLSWADVVINQLASETKSPLTLKGLAAMSQMEEGVPITKANDAAFQAVFMTDSRRKQALEGVGDDPTKETLLNATLNANPVWKQWSTLPANTSPRNQALMDAGIRLMKDMVLIEATATYKGDSGALWWTKKPLQQAADHVIETFLPYSPLKVRGSGVPRGSASTTYSAGLGNYGATASPKPAPLSSKDLGQVPVTVVPSDVLIPKKYAGVIDDNGIKRFLDAHIGNPEWVYKNAYLQRGASLASQVGSFAAFNRSKVAPEHQPHVDTAISTAKKYGIPENFFLRLIARESGFDPRRNSPINSDGSQDGGIAQLNNKYVSSFGARIGKPNLDRYNPKDSLEAAAAALSSYHGTYRKQGLDDFTAWKLAAVAYNQGAGAVARQGGVAALNGPKAKSYLGPILEGAVAAPKATPQLSKGHRMMLEQAMRLSNKSIRLDNTSNLNSIRPMVVADGRPGPFRYNTSGPIEFDFDTIAKWIRENP